MNEKTFEQTLEIPPSHFEKMEESPVRSRLEQFIVNHLKISVAEFEKSLPVYNGFVGKIKRDITPDKLALIAKKYPNLNIAWLKLGIGNMLKEPTFDSPLNVTEMKFLQGILLPVYDLWNQIGKKSILRAMEENLIIEHLAVPGTLGCIGWIKMKGDYMFDPNKEGGIRDGEYISLRPQTTDMDKIDYGSVHCIEFNDDRDPVIRYLKKNNNTLILRAHNPRYDDINIDLSVIQSLYKVENVTRKI